MALNHITSQHELYEVLNAFPFLWDVFENLQIPLDDVIEGLSVKEHLVYLGFGEEESVHIVKRLNREVNLFLKYGDISKNKSVAKEGSFVDVSALL